MTKGTASKGQKRNKGRVHIHCRRCGETSYHKISKICSSCGFGRSAKLKRFTWMKKKVNKWRKVVRAKVR